MNILSGFILIKGIPFLMFSSFVCIFLGLLLGRITIKGINLGSSGVFIISLIYGALFSSHIKSSISQKSKKGEIIDISSNGLKILENIGLILFIGSVGFISGPNFFKNIKKNFKSYLIVGLFVILSSTLICVVIFYIAKSSSNDLKEFSAMMVGIFSGALTSTPAFSAAKASVNSEYESAVTVGYGIAYIFGVLGIVIFVQLIPKICDVDMAIEKEIINDREYKIAKRVGTDRTEQTVGSKITRDLSKDLSSNRESLKLDSKKNTEKEIKIDIKQSKFLLKSSIKKEDKNEKIKINNIDKKSKDINKLKLDKSNIEKENEVDIKIEEEEEKEEKENEDNNPEEKEKDDNQNENDNKENNKPKSTLLTLDKYGICVFSFGALIGIFIGAIKIPLSKKIFDGSCFSLTTTGGVLLTNLILGHIGNIKKLSLKVDKKVLENFRELGLILFLLGTGISGGTKFIDYFKVIYFFYGILLTLIPLITGFLFNKYVLKICLLNNLGSLTGAMTSTPALGTLINVAKTDNVGNSYAATYPISLITVVLSAQFMALLLK